MDEQLIVGHRARPAGVIVHLGAGGCRELDLYRELAPDSLVLVEAVRERATELGRRVRSMPGAEVVHAAVSGTGDPGTLRVLSLADATSLRVPTGLRDLFPGIAVRREIPVETRRPEDLLAGRVLDPAAEHWLVVDVPGEELPVLGSLRSAGLLDAFAKVVVSCGRVALYEGGAPADRVLEFMSSVGYDVLATSTRFDPDRPEWLLGRNVTRIENAALRREIAERSEHERTSALEIQQLRDTVDHLAGELEARSRLVSDLADRASDLDARLGCAERETAEAGERWALERERDAERDAERDRAIRQRESEHRDAVGLADARQLRIEKLQATLGKQAAEIEQLGAEVRRLTEERDIQARRTAEQADSIRRLETTGDRYEKVLAMLAEQREEMQRIEDERERRLTDALRSSARQIKSFVTLEAYFSHDELLPTLDGWTISPDLGVFLIQLIEERKYDAIVEFGSGASTVLMATAMLKQWQRHPVSRAELPASAGRPDTAGPELVSAEGERPDPALGPRESPVVWSSRVRSGHPPLVSFEHNRKYFDDTARKLAEAGVASMVRLHHAPLEEHETPAGERFLYYGCEDEIAELSERLGKARASVLVLVDGPPAITGKCARYPAMPIVLQYLARHRLDVVVDDYRRRDEFEIVDRWARLIEDRQIEFERVELDFEKGACLLRLA